MESTTKQYYKVHAWAKGIHPRCRKIDTKIEYINKELALDHTPEQKQEVIKQARQWLSKIKDVKAATLTFNLMTYDGTFESFTMFSPDNITLDLMKLEA